MEEIILNFLSYSDSHQEHIRKINALRDFFGYDDVLMVDEINIWLIGVNEVILYINKDPEYDLPLLYRDDHIQTWIDKTNAIISLIEQDYDAFALQPPDLLMTNVIDFNNEDNASLIEFSFRDNNDNEYGHAIYISDSPIDITQRPLYPTFIARPSELSDYSYLYRGLEPNILGFKRYISIKDFANVYFVVAAFRGKQVAFSDQHIYSIESINTIRFDFDNINSVTPPINIGEGFILTSKLYEPDAIIENAGVTLDVTNIDLRSVLVSYDKLIDNAGLTLSVDSIDLRSLLITEEISDDAQLSLDIQEIDLRQVVKSYGEGGDHMDNSSLTLSIDSIFTNDAIYPSTLEESANLTLTISSITLEVV